MTDFELPKWAKIDGQTKVIRCPRCVHWLEPTQVIGVVRCSDCNFKTYENKIEAFWVKNEEKLDRIEKLEALGIMGGETYFCTLCRVRHVAGKKIGFMHIEHRGRKEKLRVCTIPNCEEILSGKQKKYACKRNCNAFIKWQQTCKNCGHFFGLKGDGFQIRKLCFDCDAKDKGATISDWETLGISPTDSVKDFRRQLMNLKLKNELIGETLEAANRVAEYYTKRS